MSSVSSVVRKTCGSNLAFREPRVFTNSTTCRTFASTVGESDCDPATVVRAAVSVNAPCGSPLRCAAAAGGK